MGKDSLELVEQNEDSTGPVNGEDKFFGTGGAIRISALPPKPGAEEGGYRVCAKRSVAKRQGKRRPLAVVRSQASKHKGWR